MYSFSFEKGLSLLYNGKTVLSALAPWMQATPSRPAWVQDASTHSGKIYLSLKELTEKEAVFEDEDKVASITLSIKDEDGVFALFVKGVYRPVGSKYGSHLHDEKGVGIDFDIPGTKRYVDAFMNCHFWQRPFIGTKLKDIKPRTQALLVDKGTDKVYLSTTCHKAYKSEIFPFKKMLSVIAQSNTVLDDIDDCVLIGGVDKDIFKLPESVVGFGMKVMEKAGKLRKNKKYPEIFEYLGWCSWDAFHMDVTHEDLLKKCEEFKAKEIPVRWAIIDDMWGDVSCIDLKTMHRRELNDWEADPIRFPEGLKGAIRDMKEKYGLWVGMWHPTNGYWSGINPNGALNKRHGDLLEYTLEGRVWRDTPILMHSFDKKKVEKYYDLQHKFYKDCGADFTKVDNQGSCKDFAYRKGDVNTTITNLHLAIEKAAKKYYGGALINCMGMPIENFWNRLYSNINRFSGDFQPENRKWFIQHLLQCSYNSLTQGTVYTGDWDMWWSDDAQAKKNAVLRAMSGGPIYMSDELDRSIKEVIMPTVFSDGRIIRLPDPALPTADCMFNDSEHNGSIFKVFNKYNGAGIVAAFNLDENENAVTGTISPEDAGVKAGTYVAYNWFTGEASLIKKGEKINVELENYDDFRLIIFVPVKDGKAVIGLKEKYMSPLTVKKANGGIKALDDGTLLVYVDGIIKEYPVKKDEVISI
jgi:hypothetical protein